ncbi:MAG: response regulator [Fimbriimonadaceae bacterium]|nr:response regulator [Fimbriimonadaceae bacterium]
MASEILIVEDDDSERILYEDVFTARGYEVRVAADAEAALQAIRERRPDVVVLDINMPGKDGLDLLREVMDIDNKLPVVLNTAYSAYQDNFMSWSAAAYVVKSSDPAELIDTVQNVLRGGAA